MSDPRPVGMRVARPYATEEEFVLGDGLAIGRLGMIIIGAPPRAPGIVIRFEIVLAAGQPVFRGEGKVIAHRIHANGRQGLEVRFTRLDSHSKGIVERVLVLRKSGALVPAPLKAPAVDATEGLVDAAQAAAATSDDKLASQWPAKPIETLTADDDQAEHPLPTTAVCEPVVSQDRAVEAQGMAAREGASRKPIGPSGSLQEAAGAPSPPPGMQEESLQAAQVAAEEIPRANVTGAESMVEQVTPLDLTPVAPPAALASELDAKQESFAQDSEDAEPVHVSVFPEERDAQPAAGPECDVGRWERLDKLRARPLQATCPQDRDQLLERLRQRGKGLPT